MAASQSEFDRLIFEIAASTSTADIRALREYVREAFAGDPHLGELEQRISHRERLVASAEGLVEEARRGEDD